MNDAQVFNGNSFPLKGRFAAKDYPCYYQAATP